MQGYDHESQYLSWLYKTISHHHHCPYSWCLMAILASVQLVTINTHSICMVNNNKKYIRLYRKYRMYRVLAILSIKPLYIYHSKYIPWVHIHTPQTLHTGWLVSGNFNDLTLTLNTLALTFHNHSQYKCLDIYNYTLTRQVSCQWTYASVVGHFGTVT